MTAPRELPPDLAARYRVRRVLGEGGFGAVLEAEDRSLGRPVALKLLGTHLEGAADRERFAREARTTAALRHPGVVEVYDHGTAEDGTPFIAYELVDGPDLAAVLAGEGPLPLPRWREVATRVAEALHAAHAAGVIHRDVKPANVLLREDGTPVLVDFGIAREEERGTLLTAEGIILGTPGYMAEELLLGSPPTPATDQFAWAASLVELAGGEPVYGSHDPGEIIRAVSENRAPAIDSATAVRLGPPAAALARALEREASRRWESMEAFAAAVRGGDARAGESRAPTLQLDVPGGAPRAPATTALSPPGATAPPARGVAWKGLGLAAVLAGLAASLASYPDGGAPPPASRVAPAPGPDPAEAAASRALDALLGTFPPGVAPPGTNSFGDGFPRLIRPMLTLRFDRAWFDWTGAFARLRDPSARERAATAAAPIVQELVRAISQMRDWYEERGRQETLPMLGSTTREPLPGWFDVPAFKQRDASMQAAAARLLCELDSLAAPWGAATARLVAAIAANLDLMVATNVTPARCAESAARRTARALEAILAAPPADAAERAAVAYVGLIAVTRCGDKGVVPAPLAAKVLDFATDTLPGAPGLTDGQRFRTGRMHLRELLRFGYNFPELDREEVRVRYARGFQAQVRHTPDRRTLLQQVRNQLDRVRQNRPHMDHAWSDRYLEELDEELGAPR